MTVAFIVWGRSRSPELMLGLATMLAVPPLALLGAILYRRPRRPAVPTRPRDAGYVADWRRRAVIEFDGADGAATPIVLGITRIGRQDDNEICIADASVHRYHAALERSPEAGVVIRDLSGPEGNGVRINGERIAGARLEHGDVIELGKAKLRFYCTTIEVHYDHNREQQDAPAA